ncbi:hypothetical protein AWC38_SpisGene25247 [Stylophora pistillata]|uniref:Uncharacterized protein n=1 Tax=Stylophora pistillata TaxID=50429 RepID=A0A2B4R0H2_STYPI|nr:hypothetical protein AWC38_SpisGene25247 [Stylophora pistillata]
MLFGVCTDVVIRTYRKALGIDLQQLVHEDMKENFDKYPSKRLWGLARTDTNIDHRRVPNLRVFFEHQGASLPISEKAENYKPGDLITWELNPTGRSTPHIGIVVNKRSQCGKRPLIVHNIGAGPQTEDVLFKTKLQATTAGAYKYPLRKATKIALQCGLEFLEENPSATAEFVCFRGGVLKVYQETLLTLLDEQAAPLRYPSVYTYQANIHGDIGLSNVSRGIVYPVSKSARKRTDCFLPEGYAYPSQDKERGKWLLRRHPKQRIGLYKTLVNGIASFEKDPIYRVLSENRINNVIYHTFGIAIDTLGIQGIKKLSLKIQRKDPEIADCLEDLCAYLIEEDVTKLATGAVNGIKSLLSSKRKQKVRNLPEITRTWKLALSGEEHGEGPYVYAQNHEGSIGFFDPRCGLVFPIFKEDRKKTDCFLPQAVSSYPREREIGLWLFKTHSEKVTRLYKALINSIHLPDNDPICRVLSENRTNNAIRCTLELMVRTLGSEGLRDLSMQLEKSQPNISQALEETSLFLEENL